MFVTSNAIITNTTINYAPIISATAAVISASCAFLAFFSKLIINILNTGYYKLFWFSNPIKINYYNKAKNVEYKTTIRNCPEEKYSIITPVLSLQNKTREQNYVIYGLKIYSSQDNESNSTKDEMYSKLRNIILPEYKKNSSKEEDTFRRLTTSLIRQEYLNAYDTFLPKFRPNDKNFCFMIDDEFEPHKNEIYEILKEYNKKKKNNYYKEWEITDQNGNIVQFPFVIKSGHIYLLQYEQREFIIDSRILSESSNLHIKLHLSDKDYLYEIKNFKKNSFAKLMKKITYE